MEAAVKLVFNNIQNSSSERDLKSCISQTKVDKASEHYTDLAVDGDDDEHEPSDLSAENNKLSPYMAALAIIHAEDWNDDTKNEKIYNDLQRTQRCDSDLLVLKCCCVKK